MIEPLPAVFDMLQYLEMILPLVESLNDLLNKMRYILWVVALMEAVTSPTMVASWPPSWILPRIRNQVKTIRKCFVL